MNRIDAMFQKVRADGGKAFIPFLTAGDPDPDTTLRLLQGIEAAGADMIELGFPFSDPVADGPTIQASYARALAGGQRSGDVLHLVAELRRTSQIPVVAMISYSLVFKMGFERFVREALDAGLDGATVPDLPAEEMRGFVPLCRSSGFHLVGFITPSTPAQRRRESMPWMSGFIYYIAVRGITGERSGMPDDLRDNLRRIRTETDLPLAVGFGVSSPQQAREAAAQADGVIAGSAIVRRIHDSHVHGRDPVEEALAFIRSMASAVKS